MLSIYPIIEALSPQYKRVLKRTALALATVGAIKLAKRGATELANSDIIKEALSPAKKIGIGVGATVAAAEGGGAVAQGYNKLGAHVSKKILNTINNPDIAAELSDTEKNKLEQFKSLVSKNIKLGEDRAEFFRSVRPTQLIKNAFNKYQDNK